MLNANDFNEEFIAFHRILVTGKFSCDSSEGELNKDKMSVVSDVQNDRKPVTGEYVYLSDVFKYISHYRRVGHQVGRKVGDMLEVITLAALCVDERARSRLVLEPKLLGFSGAGHKVEFGLFNVDDTGSPIAEMSQLIGFVECKKVGVEQTIDAAFKRVFKGAARIPYGTPVSIRFAPKWAESVNFEVVFHRLGGVTRVTAAADGRKSFQTVAGDGERIILGLTIDGDPFLLGNDQSLRDVPQSIRACRVLEVRDHTEEGVFCLLNACLPGPQTPEKAKQASFVALDVRKGMFGQFDKRPNEKECVSVLVVTEFSHWEPKSVNMIRASIDYNLIVDDTLIISAMEEFENSFGDGFLDFITKETYLSDKRVRDITNQLIGDGRIFRDIDDGNYKSIIVDDRDRFVVV